MSAARTIQLHCSCGRLLLLREQHAGKTVQCPICGRQFVATGKNTTPPEEASTTTYGLVPEEGPSVPPLTELVPMGAEESVEPLLPKKRQRAPKQPRMRGVLEATADFLQDSIVFRFVLGIGLAGIILTYFGLQEATLSTMADTRPRLLTVQQLIKQGTKGNAHILLTDFQPLQNFVYQYRSPDLHHWQSVYVPVVPSNAVVNGRPNLLLSNQDAPPPFRVLVLSKRVPNEQELDKLLSQATLQGTVVNGIFSLDETTQRLLRESYPGTDFSRCLIFEEGRYPASILWSVFLVGSGLFLLMICILLLCIRFRFQIGT